jgi:hypothetical protein
MAVHAAAHGQIGLAGELNPRRYGAVTLLACVACLDVRAVAEVNEAGDFIHPHPLELAIVLTRMAAAAHSRFGKCHALAGVRIRMAQGALQLQISGVQFMAVGNGLLLGADIRRRKQKKEELQGALILIPPILSPSSRVS